MNFSVLPMAGGLYDQHPALLEEWQVIFSRKAAHEAKKNREREQQAKRR